jgi:hypothetical protein
MTESIAPSVSLGGFVEFASAMASGRITAVQNVIANEFGSYDPSHDFYRQIRLAITEGIAVGDDNLRVRRAVDECTPRRRSHYEAVASGWNRWRRGKDLEVFLRPIPWHASGLEVRVSPQFVWRQKRERHLVWTYFKDAELSRDGIQAAIRLIEITHPDSDCRPAVLDVRRGTVHHASSRRRMGFDAWLTGEVAAFISMVDSIRNVA